MILKSHRNLVLIVSLISWVNLTQLYAQAPQKLNYQAIARTASGAILPDSPVGVRFSIRDLSPAGAIVFQETHAVVTNEFGLLALLIGEGTPSVGLLSDIDWSSGEKYIEVEADLTGGTSYEAFGLTELVSVPYALYAQTSGNQGLQSGTAIGNTTYWDGSAWIHDNGNLFHDGNRVGIGNNTPLQRLHVQGNVNIMKDSSFMIDNKMVLRINGTNNLFVGELSGINNSIGFNNTFMGFNSGNANLVGTQNTFVGAETGVSNLDGHMNSFVGRRAGFSNVNGVENTFIGAYAGQANIDGMHNSFVGVTTGNSNTSGEENTFIGAHAGYFNGTGSFNTFLGNFSGENNTFGNNNTTLGFEADVASGNLTNATALGAGALVNASNSVIVGNTAVTSIGGQVGWSTFSDGRLKQHISKDQLGLHFILRLNPVTYSYVTKGQEGKTYNGLIAQEVEQVMHDLGVGFSGLVPPQNENDFYSIRYAEFVMPLINATKELNEKIDSLEKENMELRNRLEVIEKRLSEK